MFYFFKDIYPGLKAVLILSGFWTDFIGFTNQDRSNPASSLTRLSRTQTLRSQRQSHHMLSTRNSKWHWSPPQSSLHINAIWMEIQDLQTEESFLSSAIPALNKVPAAADNAVCWDVQIYLWRLCVYAAVCCCVYICVEPAVKTNLTLVPIKCESKFSTPEDLRSLTPCFRRCAAHYSTTKLKQFIN